MIEYKNNSNLRTIKKNHKGNCLIDGEFVNGISKDNPIMPLDIMKWKFSKNPQKEEKKNDKFRLKVKNNRDFIHASEDLIVWLGHATFFMRLNGISFLTDPVFYDLSFIKRHAELPCKVSDLENIDYILLSHGHRDHFDKKSMRMVFKNNPGAKVLLPLEMGEFFQKKQYSFEEAAWYQQYNTQKEVEVYFMPAKHWSRRGLTDFNKTLWGSFVIKFGNRSLFFAGDTSYGEHFKGIGEFFPELDYCLMPIGAYKPAYIMKQSHLSPHEALQAFKDLGGKSFIPMHYATYDLSDEPPGEPKRIIEKEKRNFEINILSIGEELLID